VAHVGEELRLVLACLRELPALVLDFLEQPHVFDRDYRLVGEGGEQLDLFVRKRPRLKARQPEHPNRQPFTHKRHGEDRPVIADLLRFPPSVFGVFEHVRDMDDLASERGAADCRSALRLQFPLLHVFEVFARKTVVRAPNVVSTFAPEKEGVV
jgi:hypothetical protein